MWQLTEMHEVPASATPVYRQELFTGLVHPLSAHLRRKKEEERRARRKGMLLTWMNLNGRHEWAVFSTATSRDTEIFTSLNSGSGVFFVHFKWIFATLTSLCSLAYFDLKIYQWAKEYTLLNLEKKKKKGTVVLSFNQFAKQIRFWMLFSSS